MAARMTSAVSETVRTHGCFIYPSSFWKAEPLGATAYHHPPAAALSRPRPCLETSRASGRPRSPNRFDPAREVGGVHGGLGPSPPGSAVGREVEGNSRDGGLDRGPERPTDVGD